MGRRLKIAAAAILILMSLLFTVFYIYTADYYRALPEVGKLMQQDAGILREDSFVLLPSLSSSDIGLVFYPGGKVEHTAYIPLLQKLSKKGVNCILVKMPYNLAVFNPNAFEKAVGLMPEVKNWYIGGHSLGGAMASSFAAGHPRDVKGLVLLGAYIYGNVPEEKAVTIYGSEDKVLDRAKINYSKNIHIIEGGNHASFGAYGEQAGDGKAAITPDQQQEKTAYIIMEFIKALK